MWALLGQPGQAKLGTIQWEPPREGFGSGDGSTGDSGRPIDGLLES